MTSSANELNWMDRLLEELPDPTRLAFKGSPLLSSILHDREVSGNLILRNAGPIDWLVGIGYGHYLNVYLKDDAAECSRRIRDGLEHFGKVIEKLVLGLPVSDTVVGSGWDIQSDGNEDFVGITEWLPRESSPPALFSVAREKFPDIALPRVVQCKPQWLDGHMLYEIGEHCYRIPADAMELISFGGVSLMGDGGMHAIWVDDGFRCSFAFYGQLVIREPWRCVVGTT